jgi:hypothetical protein
VLNLDRCCRMQSCIEAGGKKCEPVIKSIDGVPTREHVERLLMKASSSKELLPSPQRVLEEAPSFGDDTVKVLSRSHSKRQMKKSDSSHAKEDKKETEAAQAA